MFPSERVREKISDLPINWYTDPGQPDDGFCREEKIASCTGMETPSAKFFVILGSAKQ